MNQDFDGWLRELSKLVAAALADFTGIVGDEDEMEMFAVDCHPWNGGVFLAFLTRAELTEDPLLSEPSEMAAWKYYDFAEGLPSWQAISEIGSQMKTAYKIAGDRAEFVRMSLQTCAMAIASDDVQNELAKFRLTKRFKITVPHPDSNLDYFPPNSA